MSEGPKRQLTLLDCFGLGINGIIGSGIFLLPATLYRSAGGRSPLAWLLVGSLCTLVALCFAEAAGRTDRSGGPYRFACDAFGSSATPYALSAVFASRPTMTSARRTTSRPTHPR